MSTLTPLGSLTLPGPLVTVDWLAANLHHPDLVVLDAHMAPPGTPPGTAPIVRIVGARRFDFDGRIKDPHSPLPHMMPDDELFTREAQALGLHPHSVIVVYDRSGLFSAARAWWMLRAMGHQQVAVLNGGLPAWQAAGYRVEPEQERIIPAGTFVAAPQPGLFCDAQLVQQALDDGHRLVVDARGAARFRGEEAEPRPGVRAGHMPGAVNLPYASLINNGHLLALDLLQPRVDAVLDREVGAIFSCGSGVTACILALAAELCGYRDMTVYDGSWSEWGADTSRPVITG